MPTSRDFIGGIEAYPQKNKVSISQNLRLACQITGISVEELENEISSKIREAQEAVERGIPRLKQMLESEGLSFSDLPAIKISETVRVQKPTPLVDAFELNSHENELVEAISRIVSEDDDVLWLGNPQRYETLKETLLQCLRYNEVEDPSTIETVLDVIQCRSHEERNRILEIWWSREISGH